MKIAAFLPAKGSSSRIPSKNMRLMDGKPLFLHTLEKLAQSSLFDEVWLDTESDEVIALASSVECLIHKRDESLASNKTDGNKLFMNQVAATEADIYVQILCTSPFIKIETIEKAINILRDDPNYDSVELVKREKQYTWSNGTPDYNLRNIPNSVDLPDVTIETMGLYVVRRETALKTQRRIGDRPYLLEAEPIEAIDVNFPPEFELANLIAAGQREEHRKLLANIRAHLSSPLLSDVMDDLGLDGQLVLGLTPNRSQQKLFGHAKTLKLRAIQNGEDFRAIYKALDSYKTVIPGDVIVVENETPDYAYFGELNANLAIRSGAVGAIIGGKTRDNDAVLNLGFPTFSTGYVCRDVRKRAVTESINCPISLFGVRVCPGDLIFADQEGVVVIPKAHEKAVLDEVFRRINTEKNILLDIANGARVEELVSDHGTF